MKNDYWPRSMYDPAAVEKYRTEQWSGHHLTDDPRAFVESTDELRAPAPYLDVLPARARILDGGCGLGMWSLYLASRGFDVVGLDVSSTTIARLREKFPDRAFVVGDVRQTRLPAASFDAYISWGTFEHFEEGPGACLAEARRVLKPHGLLAITAPFQNRRHLARDRRELWRWDEHFDRVNGYLSPMVFYQWRFTEPELLRELAIQGFLAERVEPIATSTGIHRWLTNDLHLRAGSLAYRVVGAAASLVMSPARIGHMLIVIARRGA